MECYTYLRNVTDLLSDGKTPYERRFGKPSKGPIIPFGSLVEYHPITAKDQSRIHQFGKRVLPGIFLICALMAEGIWKGKILVAAFEELENLTRQKSMFEEIHVRRLNAKEVTSKNSELFHPSADGTKKLSGRDHGVRESTPRQDQPVMSEDLREEPQENSERSQPTESQDDAEAQWKEISFIVITSKLEFTCTCRKKNH